MNREVYQDIILDHFRAPRNRDSLKDSEGIFEVRNPNCGDIVKLRKKTSPGHGDDVLLWTHDAQGCAASVASASIMCEFLSGKTVEACKTALKDFLDCLSDDKEDSVFANGDEIELEALLFFKNVPARKLCVSLAWTCAENALATVSTGK